MKKFTKTIFASIVAIGGFALVACNSTESVSSSVISTSNVTTAPTTTLTPTTTPTPTTASTTTSTIAIETYSVTTKGLSEDVTVAFKQKESLTSDPVDLADNKVNKGYYLLAMFTSTSEKPYTVSVKIGGTKYELDENSSEISAYDYFTEGTGQGGFMIPGDKVNGDIVVELSVKTFNLTINDGAHVASEEDGVNQLHVYDTNRETNPKLDDYISGADIPFGTEICIFEYNYATPVKLTVKMGDEIIVREYNTITPYETDDEVEFIEFEVTDDLYVTTEKIDEVTNEGVNFKVDFDSSVKSLSPMFMNTKKTDGEVTDVEALMFNQFLRANYDLRATIFNSDDKAYDIHVTIDGKNYELNNVSNVISASSDDPTSGIGGFEIPADKLTGNVYISFTEHKEYNITVNNIEGLITSFVSRTTKADGEYDITPITNNKIDSNTNLLVSFINSTEKAYDISVKVNGKTFSLPVYSAFVSAKDEDENGYSALIINYDELVGDVEITVSEHKQYNLTTNGADGVTIAYKLSYDNEPTDLEGNLIDSGYDLRCMLTNTTSYAYDITVTIDGKNYDLGIFSTLSQYDEDDIWSGLSGFQITKDKITGDVVVTLTKKETYNVSINSNSLVGKIYDEGFNELTTGDKITSGTHSFYIYPSDNIEEYYDDLLMNEITLKVNGVTVATKEIQSLPFLSTDFENVTVDGDVVFEITII